MKNTEKLSLKDIEYFSYGMDYNEQEEPYYYLQTASNGYLDYSIIESKYKIIPLIVGNILSSLTGKRLVKW